MLTFKSVILRYKKGVDRYTIYPPDYIDIIAYIFLLGNPKKVCYYSVVIKKF